MPDIFVADKPKPLVKTSAPKLKPQAGRVWSAFISRPKNLRFETQKDEEKIILVLRHHPVTNLPWLILALIIFLTPFLLVSFISLAFIPGNFRFMALICWYLLNFAFVFERFLIWFFNVKIITDERVFDIDFPTLLYRDIKEAKIDKIQDISVKTGGYLRSLFNFGDVLVQTAGAVSEICLEDVPNPAKVSQIINDLMLGEEKEHQR